MNKKEEIAKAIEGSFSEVELRKLLQLKLETPDNEFSAAEGYSSMVLAVVNYFSRRRNTKLLVQRCAEERPGVVELQNILNSYSRDTSSNTDDSPTNEKTQPGRACKKKKTTQNKKKTTLNKTDSSKSTHKTTKSSHSQSKITETIDGEIIESDQKLKDELDASRIHGSGKDFAIKLAQFMASKDLFEKSYTQKIRVKPEQKLIDKKKEKRVDVEKRNYELHNITDVVGLRFVALFRQHIPVIFEELIEQIKSEDPTFFKPDGIEEIIVYSANMKNDDVFPKIKSIMQKSGENPEMVKHRESNTGYSSVHIVARSNETTTLGSCGDFNIPAEIQLRTVFEDAWGEIDHKLGYKNISGKRLSRSRKTSISRHLRTLKSFADSCTEYSDNIYFDSHYVSDTDIPPKLYSVDENQAALTRFEELNIPENYITDYKEIAKLDDILEPGKPMSELDNPTKIEIATRYANLAESVSNDDFPTEKSFDIFMYYVKLNEAINRMDLGSDENLKLAEKIYKDVISKFPGHPLPHCRLGQVYQKREEFKVALSHFYDARDRFKTQTQIELSQREDALSKREQNHLQFVIPSLIGFSLYHLAQNPKYTDQQRMDQTIEAYKATSTMQNYPFDSAGDNLNEYTKCINNLLYYATDVANLAKELKLKETHDRYQEYVSDHLKRHEELEDFRTINNIEFLDTFAEAFYFTNQKSNCRLCCEKILKLVLGNKGEQISGEVERIVKRAYELLDEVRQANDIAV